MRELFHCPLCGFKFEKADAVCTHGCPLGKFCKLIKCPSCQYEFPEPSRPLRWLARWLHAPLASAGTLDLTQIEAGETVEFAGMAPGAEGRGRALAVYGMTPGAFVTLQQKQPAFVLRVGETELALEKDIARQILIKRRA
jgi:DtxR family Mn-dependent transcriptional regulator